MVMTNPLPTLEARAKQLADQMTPQLGKQAIIHGDVLWGNVPAVLLECAAELSILRAQQREWIKENAPGGWIDDYRKRAEAAEREVASLREERDHARFAVDDWVGRVAVLEEEKCALASALKTLFEWCDSDQRETFSHRHKDDGVIYTPYRVMASKVRDTLAALSGTTGPGK